MSSANPNADWQLVHFIECLPDALLVTDLEGRIQLANSLCADLFGYTRDEMVGLPVEALVPESLRGRHEALRRGYAERPRDRPMGSGVEIVARHKDGRAFHVDIELRVRATPRGRAVLAVVRALDRAERSDAEADLAHVRARRLRELDHLVLFARIALDDSAELTSRIRAAALRLSRALPPGSDVREDAQEIRRSAEAAAELLDALRERVARQTASAAGIASGSTGT